MRRDFVRGWEKLSMLGIAELVRLLARNLALEDVLWEEILVSIRDVTRSNRVIATEK